MEDTEVKQPEMSPEQLAKFEEFKKQRLEHFNKEIPNLKVQKEYEQLLTEIDELYLRRVMVDYKMAQLKATSPEEQKPKEEPTINK